MHANTESVPKKAGGRSSFQRCAAPRRRRGAGFSLVEVCAAIVLLTVIISGVIGAQAAALNLTRTARDTEIATGDAQAALEEMLLLAAEAIPGAYPTGVPIAAWSDRNLSGERIVPTYPNMPGASVPDPVEIRVTVTWNDHAGRRRTLFLSTLKVR